jgi:hypothetical protein
VSGPKKTDNNIDLKMVLGEKEKKMEMIVCTHDFPFFELASRRCLQCCDKATSN